MQPTLATNVDEQTIWWGMDERPGKLVCGEEEEEEEERGGNQEARLDWRAMPMSHTQEHNIETHREEHTDTMRNTGKTQGEMMLSWP